MKQLHAHILGPAFACLALCVQPAMAGEAMTGAEFDAYTKGKTFYYGANGAPYGGEEYLDNQRVRWSFLDGNCKEGIWYEEAGNICFVYEDRPEPQCWAFTKADQGLAAQYVGAASAAPLYEVEQSADPMLCLGPQVGV